MCQLGKPHYFAGAAFFYGQHSITVSACAVVVNFYAPWCPWCQRLEPTWEAVTQEVHRRYPESDGRLRFAKVCPACTSLPIP